MKSLQIQKYQWYNIRNFIHTFGLCLKRDSSICITTTVPPRIIEACNNFVVQISLSHWYISTVERMSVSALSAASVNGESFAHSGTISSRISFDLSKKLPGQILFLVLPVCTTNYIGQRHPFVIAIPWQCYIINECVFCVFVI